MSLLTFRYDEDVCVWPFFGHPLSKALETVLRQQGRKSIGVVHDGIFIRNITPIRVLAVLLIMALVRVIL
jgi:hypothetical protein